MTITGTFSKLANARRAAGCMGVAILFMPAGIAAAQAPAPAGAAPEATMSTPNGYSSHHAVDFGGRMIDQVGSADMYGTLVNLHTGPRLLGETTELHAMPGNKNSLVDNLTLFSTGFGGDPLNTTRLTANKGKAYEFSGIFRRDRLYSNYDLLANPNLPSGLSIYNDVGGTLTAAAPWPQVKQSPVKFNIVRRMTDTNLTLAPFSTFTLRLAYSHSTMEGPTLSPSYTPLGMKYNALLRQWERNGSDDFLGAIDWKPRAKTKITLEEQANHYKSDTFFTLDPSLFTVQESDGTPAYLGNYTSFTPYGIGGCTTNSMGTGYTNATNYTILSPSNNSTNLPVINPACAVVTSYMRSQPTRIWTPTETLRLQSSDFKNIILNGNVHYTRGRSDMFRYYENVQGLNGAVRSAVDTGGNATAQHTVIGADFGIVWRATSAVSLADQATYSATHEPSAAIIPLPATLSTPATAGNETINYSGTLTPGTGSLPHGNTGGGAYNYYGQEYFINNLTASWDASARARFALTYRYSNRNIGQGTATPHNQPIPIVVSDPVSGEISITENAGVFNAATHPAKNWDLNGSVEVGYADNAFTAVGQRQFKIYRVHTIYRPKTWITVTGSFSDRERHNNTNNNQAAVAAGDDNFNGQLQHVDHNRIGSMGLALSPNEHYSLNVNYSYSDVYAATNICFSSGAAAATATTPAFPGVATLTAGGAPNLCTGNATWFARDFMDAPTQSVMAGVSYSPVDKVKLNAGYSINDVNGSRFFNDSRDVNGSMVSKYQTPYVNVAYSMHPNLIWKADYNYYGYGEGGPSGATMCSTTTATTATVAPCTSFGVPVGLTEGSAGATAPRRFQANNITLGIHYEF